MRQLDANLSRSLATVANINNDIRTIEEVFREIETIKSTIHQASLTLMNINARLERFYGAIPANPIAEEKLGADDNTSFSPNERSDSLLIQRSLFFNSE